MASMAYQPIAAGTPSSLFGGDVDLLSTGPPSPTAALDDDSMGQWRANASAAAAKRRSLSRRVTFDEETKQHDGLSTRPELLDAIVKRYFVHQREVSELDVIELCEKRVNCIRDMHEDLQDIISRLEMRSAEENGTAAVPVLPRGGGMCTKLCSQHIPYIRILARVVDAAAQRQARAQ